MKVNVYSAVITRGTTAEVRAYLYEHTKVAAAASGTPSGRTYVILRTTVEFETAGYDKAHEEARRLATYQCERLQSGLHFAVVGGKDTEARHVIAQQISCQDVGKLHWHTTPATVR